jgi:hypothetical protein
MYRYRPLHLMLMLTLSKSTVMVTLSEPANLYTKTKSKIMVF